MVKILIKLQILLVLFTILVQSEVINICEPQGIHLNYGNYYSNFQEKDTNQFQFQITYFTQQQCHDNFLLYQIKNDELQSFKVQNKQFLFDKLTKKYFYSINIEYKKEFEDQFIIYQIFYPDLNAGKHNLRNPHEEEKFLKTKQFEFFSPKNHFKDKPTKLIFFGDFDVHEDSISGGTISSLLNISESSDLKQQYQGIVHTGDLAYDMSDNNGQVGLEYMVKTQEIFTQFPYITVAGNHETDLDYFQNSYPNIQQNDKLYYSWNIGNMHLIALYLNEEQGDSYIFGSDYMNEQLLFLEQNLILANNQENRQKYPWIIVYMHHPIHCSAEGEDCNMNSENILRNAVQVILEKHGVDLVIQSHAHQYERSYPIHSTSINSFKDIAQYEDGEQFSCQYHENKDFKGICKTFKNPKGIVYTLEGSAGTNHLFFEFDYPLQEYTVYKGNVETKDEPGVLQTGYGIVTTLSDNLLLYEHYNTRKKQVVDAFKIYKEDIYNKWGLQEEDSKFEPEYYNFQKNSSYLMQLFTVFIIIAVLGLFILIFYVCFRKICVQQSQQKYSEINI